MFGSPETPGSPQPSACLSVLRHVEREVLPLAGLLTACGSSLFHRYLPPSALADYYSPTVIQQTIPEVDMTPLERLILTHVFDADAEDGGLYFYSEQGPSDVVSVSRADLVEALAASRNQQSVANVLVAEQVDGASPGDDGNEIELDLRATSWEFLLQNVVQRSCGFR